jgi:hypothetical protein
MIFKLYATQTDTYKKLIVVEAENLEIAKEKVEAELEETPLDQYGNTFDSTDLNIVHFDVSKPVASTGTTIKPSLSIPATEDEFASWRETHFEVVNAIALENAKDKPCQLISELRMDGGRMALWDLANELTKEFENKNKGRKWDGEFYDEIDAFIDSKLNPLPTNIA